MAKLLVVTVRSKSRAVSELIDDMFDESRYNSRARPGADSGKPDSGGSIRGGAGAMGSIYPE